MKPLFSVSFSLCQQTFNLNTNKAEVKHPPPSSQPTSVRYILILSSHALLHDIDNTNNTYLTSWSRGHYYKVRAVQLFKKILSLVWNPKVF
jgi:hypothetical protein